MNPLLKRRAGPGYNRWKAQVTIRDNHACRIRSCRSQVEADHIRQWAKHLEMAFNPANGIMESRYAPHAIRALMVGKKSSKSFLISWWNDQPNRNRPQGKRVASLLSRMQLITGPMEPVKLLSFNARPHQIEHFRLANSLPA